MNGEQDYPVEERVPVRLINYRVQVARIEDPSTVPSEDDLIPVLDIRVQVRDRYPAQNRSQEAVVLSVQDQIRAALEAARPGGN